MRQVGHIRDSGRHLVAAAIARPLRASPAFLQGNGDPAQCLYKMALFRSAFDCA